MNPSGILSRPRRRKKSPLHRFARAPALSVSFSNSPPPVIPESPAPPPPQSQIPKAPVATDPAYNPELAHPSSKILYLPLRNRPCLGRPLLIFCVVAFPDADRVDYTALLPDVLANLPADGEVNNYRIGLLGRVFAAGGERKAVPSPTPSWKWTLNPAGVYKSVTGGL